MLKHKTSHNIQVYVVGCMHSLGEVHGSVVGDRDLESVLASVTAASDSAVGDARNRGYSAGHEVHLLEVHAGHQLGSHVHCALALVCTHNGVL